MCTCVCWCAYTCYVTIPTFLSVLLGVCVPVYIDVLAPVILLHLHFLVCLHIYVTYITYCFFYCDMWSIWSSHSYYPTFPGHYLCCFETIILLKLSWFYSSMTFLNLLLIVKLPFMLTTLYCYSLLRPQRKSEWTFRRT